MVSDAQHGKQGAHINFIDPVYTHPSFAPHDDVSGNFTPALLILVSVGWGQLIRAIFLIGKVSYRLADLHSFYALSSIPKASFDLCNVRND